MSRGTQDAVDRLAVKSPGADLAAELVVSPKTAGSHVEHIYRKIDASNRAQASLFAMRHGLMRDTPAADGS